MTGDEELVRALALDYASATISTADRAMLDYATELTRTPGLMEEVHVSTLREAGFSDTAVLDICQVTSYFNFVNRMADGLGVEMEEGWSDDDLVLSRGEFEARRDGRP